MNEIVLRFMQGAGSRFSSDALIADAIVAQEKTAMPFTPSHVEALTPDGLYYIGAHINGGVMRRPVGYDKGKVAKLLPGYDADAFPDGLCDMLVRLPATKEQTDAFNAYMDASVGKEYDWISILGFVLPGHFHIPQDAICSANVTLGLRNKTAPWFPYRLAAPAHLVDPRDLLLMLSTHVQLLGV